MNLDDAIDAYLMHLKVERNLAENTVKAYANDLSQFTEYCEENEVAPAIDQISGEDISEFLLVQT